MKDCVLCHPERREDQNVLLSNEYCMFLQLVEQEIEGAGIIVPRKHRETVFDLTEEEWLATYQLLNEVKRYIDQHFKPDGYNIGWNSGKAAGQHIIHSHMHVIPRYSDERMAGKGIRYLFKSENNRRTGRSLNVLSE